MAKQRTKPDQGHRPAGQPKVAVLRLIDRAAGLMRGGAMTVGRDGLTEAPGDLPDGYPVRIDANDGTILGWGLFEADSDCAVRVFHRVPARPDCVVQAGQAAQGDHLTRRVEHVAFPLRGSADAQRLSELVQIHHADGQAAVQ